MPIKISSTTPNFRRGGIAHSETETYYADDYFSKEQLSAFDTEPELTVEEIKKLPKSATMIKRDKEA